MYNKTLCWKPDGYHKRLQNTWRQNLDKEIQDNGMNWRQVEAARNTRQTRDGDVWSMASAPLGVKRI